MGIFRNKVKLFFINLQNTICTGLSHADGKSLFNETKWKHAGGGGGITQVIINGSVIEKGGVNFSAVTGKLPERIAVALKTKPINYFATGISIVIHPSHPFIPIIHTNLRYFELENGVSWFGGGMDLTPIYINIKEAENFHAGLKKICDTHNKKFYPEFKSWADTYFFIPHRNETRGVGGIFFDKLGSKNLTPVPSPKGRGVTEEHYETINPKLILYNNKNTAIEFFPFIKDIGNYFLPAFLPLIEANRKKKFTDKHKEFQLFRRGRYVEFNLVYDLGTKFGLETGGRTESILMSMPPMAKWTYDYRPVNGSEEERTMKYLMG